MSRRICFSHIAWEAADESAVAELLQSRGIDAVDVAPGRYFPDPARATRADALRVRGLWQSWNIDILGMQALLFGVVGLNLFGDANARVALLERLSAVARIAGWMGATRLVFGSPRNRDRGTLTLDQAMEIAVPFFRTLGERAVGYGVQFCLEPNPPRYACNFMTTTDEGAAVVRAIAHPGIRLHLDAGTMAVNGEHPHALVAAHHDVVGYVHASEPDLTPVVDGPCHRALGAALAQHLPTMPVSIEMRTAGIHAIDVAIVSTCASYAIGKRSNAIK